MADSQPPKQRKLSHSYAHTADTMDNGDAAASSTSRGRPGSFSRTPPGRKRTGSGSSASPVRSTGGSVALSSTGTSTSNGNASKYTRSQPKIGSSWLHPPEDASNHLSNGNGSPNRSDHDRIKQTSTRSSARLRLRSCLRSVVRLRPPALGRPRAVLVAILLIVSILGIGAVFSTDPGLGHIRIPPSPQSEAALAAQELSKPKVDLTGHPLEKPIEEVEAQRSFEEPDYALLSSKQPHEIGCDIPVDWTGYSGAPPDSTGKKEEDGVLVFLGVFSAYSAPGKSAEEMKARRDLYRQVYWGDFPDHLVTKKFILGMPPAAATETIPAAVARAKAIRLLEQEAAQYGDIVILDIDDNVDYGKTYEYFRWVAKHFAGEGRKRGRPRFVMKTDDDTLLVAPNMLAAFRNLDCSANIYWGTSAGRSGHFARYFRGMAYALSWPLVSWIGSADMPAAHIVKIEDARTGQWLRHLDPDADPIRRIDMGWTMSDWNQIQVGPETVALHWLKWDEWVTEQHDRIIRAWNDANLTFDWANGIDPAISYAKGREIPEDAQKEHQRQKDMGWDTATVVILDPEEPPREYRHG